MRAMLLHLDDRESRGALEGVYTKENADVAPVKHAYTPISPLLTAPSPPITTKTCTLSYRHAMSRIE